MATLDLTVTNITQTAAIIRWELIGIGMNMSQGGLCTEYPDGTQTKPGTILASATAYVDGDLKSAKGNYSASKSRFPDAAFYCYGFGKTTANGYYTPAGGGLNSVTWEWPEEPQPTRPTDWEWWSTVALNQPIAFTVAEWEAFYAKIDEFRAYKGLEPWPNFVPVSKGAAISAKMVNETRAAIAPMTLCGRCVHLLQDQADGDGDHTEYRVRKGGVGDDWKDECGSGERRGLQACTIVCNKQNC